MRPQRTSEALEGLDGPLRALNGPAQQGTRAINLFCFSKMPNKQETTPYLISRRVMSEGAGDVQGGMNLVIVIAISIVTDKSKNNNIFSIRIAEVAMMKAFRPHASGQSMVSTPDTRKCFHYFLFSRGETDRISKDFQTFGW